MAEQHRLCPGCGKEPVIVGADTRLGRLLECNGCSFQAWEDDWQRRTPSPATAKLIRCIKADLEPTHKMLDAFLAEWPDPATPPAPEQPEPESSSRWKCSVCGQPVWIGGDRRPWHVNGPANHDAELSDADRKTWPGLST